MKTVEVIGYKRANLGKAESKQLREEGSVPCVLYGGKDQIHFHAPMILFRDIVYTPEARFVDLNIEGEKRRAILQDIQFHPVSEVILHADFLEIFSDKKIKMSIPVKPIGSPPGVQQGGKLMLKNRHLHVKALPDDMPEYVEIDVSNLNLGSTFRVYEVEAEDFEILNNPRVTIAMVNIPRGARDFDSLDEEEEEMLVEGAEELAEGAEAPAEGGEAPAEGGDTGGDDSSES